MSDFLLVIHGCKDFGAWKAAYDADAPNRTAAGLTDLQLLHATDDANRILLLFGVGDMAKARTMAASPELAATMQAAGVVGAPDVHFLTGEYTPAEADTYLTIEFKVSGIDTFKRGYAMDAADRRAAGMTDVGLAEDADDPNHLYLMWAVADVGRVNAFLARPELAEHQVKNAGLLTKPEPHFWTG